MLNQKEQQYRQKRYQSEDSELEAKWFDIEKDYREKYPTITDDDVEYQEGEFDYMTRCLAYRTHRSREQVRDEIRTWYND